MSKVLQINSSIYSEQGQSSRLANEFVEVLRRRGAQVVTRDLAAEPIPHLDAERFRAFGTPPEKRNAAQRVVAEHSDRLIAELREADVIVLGLPMYNFGVPSVLKAYFDHVARAGVTFRYTDQGPVGLLTGKEAYVFATRGGYYAGTPLDTQTAYVRDFLRFLGIADVEFVHAEGLAIGEASREKALAAARELIGRLAPTLSQAA